MVEPFQKAHDIASRPHQVTFGIQGTFYLPDPGKSLGFQGRHLGQVLGEAGLISIQIILHATLENGERFIDGSEQYIHAPDQAGCFLP